MKTGKSYYLCQIIGTLGFFTFIVWAGLSHKVDQIYWVSETVKFIKLTSISLLVSHFIVRFYIKKHIINNSFSFKVYSLAILWGAIAALLIYVSWGLMFGDADKDPLSIHYIFNKFTINVFVLTLWGLLYFSITTIRERVELKKQLEDHELASLMNKINPHFLFNSLNTIRGMIYEDKEKSAELVTKLSTLFRYNLSTDTKAHTSLAGELEICQHYLAIEDIRLGERLKIELDISPESNNAKIPTMGILTLVENAIKHGISNLQQGGTLELSTQVKDNKLLIQVSNPHQANLVKSGTQVGLKNLQQRIALIFGSQGELKQSHNDNTFTVNITLPYEVV